MNIENKARFAFINRTGADVGGFDSIILAAIANDGEFGEDFADIFTLTRCPEGSAAAWALDFSEDN